MKLSDILVFSVALATATAVPVKRDDTVEITFYGAAGTQFTQSFPTDSTVTQITNPLSISRISSSSDDAECTFSGSGGSVTTIEGAYWKDVGPPQTQIFGTCTKFSSLRRRSDEVMITFIGAADAQFTQSFPTDSTVTDISNTLSISHISNSDASVECFFTGTDNSYTVVNGAVEVDVGPPQTQVSGQCFKLSTPTRRSSDVTVTFTGAVPEAEFTEQFSLDGNTYSITNALSVSHIKVDEGDASCIFYGIDGSITSVIGAETVDVGPPQTQVQGYCVPL
ncbi:hypothetical protein N7520_004617 [Penicillium odoratum]|uniref:uncharacterized protein n=1 Tax=Penicillium odoratum TaxID=1167516 RepID=UPI00254805CA|nr:uncharacterized protein N7520_004617 [Penicillium odoratum]KAJ5765058.1 hypothetical protein N7520_004617 [Penicillium odoratum]